MAGFRSLLHSLSRLLGDINTVKRGRVGRGRGRRAAGLEVARLQNLTADPAAATFCHLTPMDIPGDGPDAIAPRGPRSTGSFFARLAGGGVKKRPENSGIALFAFEFT